jgi:hypothetical protein
VVLRFAAVHHFSQTPFGPPPGTEAGSAQVTGSATPEAASAMVESQTIRPSLGRRSASQESSALVPPPRVRPNDESNPSPTFVASADFIAQISQVDLSHGPITPAQAQQLKQNFNNSLDKVLRRCRRSATLTRTRT